jgi:hypothetical protein
MTSDESNKTPEWESIDSLLATVTNPHGLDITWEGKNLKIAYMYLNDDEIPDSSERLNKINKDMSPDEKDMRVLRILSEEMAFAMISKAQKMHPEFPTLKITKEQFLALDPMLRSLITTNITNASQTRVTRF